MNRLSKEISFDKRKLPERVQLNEPVLICYRMLRRCLMENATTLLFFEDKIERRTIGGKITGRLRTPKPFASYMLHILENDPVVAASVESTTGDGTSELKVAFKEKLFQEELEN
ncbi:hypothetical protein FJZ31_18605 [Candidatus Poribacteria bacterium]|nr:hypothetical protein [Candidatus Poribacteria bacterium]